MTNASELKYSLLTEPLIRYRRAGDGGTVCASLPQLFLALAADEVRDYPGPATAPAPPMARLSGAVGRHRLAQGGENDRF